VAQILAVIRVLRSSERFKLLDKPVGACNLHHIRYQTCLKEAQFGQPLWQQVHVVLAQAGSLHLLSNKTKVI
jgi:hypothetical protein